VCVYIIQNSCHSHWISLYNCVMIPSVHMTSLAYVHPGEGSSSVALLKVSSLFPLKGFFFFWEVFPDPM